MRVPFLDLKAHHDPIRDEVMAAIAAVVDRNAFAGGPFVAAFEEDFARYCTTKFAVGVGNGTDSLWFSLLALGVGPGDEVLCPPMTFMATAEAISYAGAKPVFVDIHPQTYTMDPAKIEAAITPRTRAIMPVHLFGQCADMDPILDLARKHRLWVVEDAAQAQGAEYSSQRSEDRGQRTDGRGHTTQPGNLQSAIRNPQSAELAPPPISHLPSPAGARRAGSLGHAGSFSFYPGKNLGAWGEAGAVTTNDPGLRDRLAMFREHGQPKKYHHDVIGWNGRMDGIQGAVLKVKLKYLDKANDGRRRAAAQYRALLADVPGLTLPVEAPYARHIWHIYAVRVQGRDDLMKRLGDRGVATGIHYPIPVHLTGAYAHLGHKRGDFPVSEACADEFMSLPMYPELTEEQVSYVAQAVRTELRTVICGMGGRDSVEPARKGTAEHAEDTERRKSNEA